jgi:hypothetical protein
MNLIACGFMFRSDIVFRVPQRKFGHSGPALSKDHNKYGLRLCGIGDIH